jgi:hypothetical protein
VLPVAARRAAAADQPRPILAALPTFSGHPGRHRRTGGADAAGEVVLRQLGGDIDIVSHGASLDHERY